MVVIVAAVLAFASIALRSKQEANVLIEKKGAILASIGQGQGANEAPNKDVYVNEQYEKYIVSSFFVNAQGEKTEGSADQVLNTLSNLREIFEAKKEFPVFQAKLDDGKILYVVPMTGAGLWGPVWGYIALESDCNMVYGAKFDHKGETPGLGAEIALPDFSKQFVGKQLFDGDKFASINLTKGVGSSDGNPYAVDAISGGTLTSNGVKAMLNDCLSDYVPFFDKVRAEQVQPVEVVEPAPADSTASNL